MVDNIGELSSLIVKLTPIIRTIVAVVVAYVIFSLVLGIIKKALLKRVKKKRQRSNVEIFSKVLKYVFFLILILLAVSSYSGSWAGLGLGVGLFSAALGWALQKPITGVAAWIMIVTKRPFEIGDRIIIGNVRGDVKDITLTHIYIREIGGIVAGEENSGRIIMVPNSTLFEKNIINYTSEDEYILDQVSFNITYESNLDKAIDIAIKVAEKETKDIIKKTKKRPYVRTYFKPSGIAVNVRYFAPAKNLQELSSRITQSILRMVKREKEVRIAYPHTEVLLKEKAKKSLDL